MKNSRKIIFALVVAIFLGVMTTLPVNAQQATAPIQVSSSTTNLLFGEVTSELNRDTGIAIGNLSTQDGICELTYKGTVSIKPEQITIEAGTIYAVVLSSSAPAFSGSVAAKCNFPDARGYALIGDTDTKESLLEYLALRLDSFALSEPLPQ